MHVITLQAPQGNLRQSGGQDIFCNEAGLLLANPAGQFSSIQVKTDEASSVRPFEPKEYKVILAAVGKSGLQPRNAARVKACMQLQLWSGLSLR